MYISEYPLTMGCKVKSVAMAAAASNVMVADHNAGWQTCLLYTSPSPRDS